MTVKLSKHKSHRYKCISTDTKRQDTKTFVHKFPNVRQNISAYTSGTSLQLFEIGDILKRIEINVRANLFGDEIKNIVFYYFVLLMHSQISI